MNTQSDRSPTVSNRSRSAPRRRLAFLAVLIGALALGALALLTPMRNAHAQQQPIPPPIIIIKSANLEEVQEDDTVEFQIVVQHTGAQADPAQTVMLDDALPADDLGYVADSFSTNTGQGGFNPDNNTILWNGALKAGEQATIKYKAIVKPLPVRAVCNPIINTANGSVLSADQAPISLPPSHVILKRACDLGDAPDSTNHAGVAMTAYPGPVGAKYPTVYDPTTGAPSGPLHRAPRADAWLGPRVSGERDADLSPDQDLVTNLKPPSDIPNLDNFDDGILRMPAVANCVATDMEVQVSVVGAAKNRYINVWIDWNRDGDWDDLYTQCPGQIIGDWVVRDFLTNLAPGVHAVTLPVFLPVAFPSNQIKPNWMRVTLSERVAELDSTLSPTRADGRGPLGGFKYGETEDYRAYFEPPTAPHLEMIKQANVTHVNPGGIIEWSITIFNTGGAPANGVLMYDPIPAGTSYVGGSVNATAPTVSFNAGMNRIEWTGNIPAGGSVTIKFKVQVSPNIDCNAVIVNRAELINPATGQAYMSAAATVKVNCDSQPVLDIRKTADVTNVAPGGVIEYTIVIVNGGTGPAIGVVMHDPIPAGTSYVGGSVNSTAPTSNYNGGANRIEWTGNIPAGGSVTIKFKVQVSPNTPCGSMIENRAAIIGATGQPLAQSGVATPVICPEPKLEIKKSADVATVLPGGIIQYTIVIANSGSGPATGVMMQDPVPAGTSYVAGSLNASAPTPDDSNPSVMKWTGNIPAGGSVTITFKVQVSPDFKCPDRIHNRAELMQATGAVNQAAAATVEVICPDKPILSITKQADVTSVAPGGFIQYTIVVNNSGNAAATGVTVLDPIPGGTSYVAGSLSASAPTTDDSNPSMMKWVGAIPAGGSVTIIFKVQVSANVPCDGVIHNRAGIVPQNPTVPPLIAEAHVKVDCGEPKLEIKKSASVTQTVAGGVIEYTIVVNNSGSGPAIGVTVIDPIPAGTTYVAGSLNATLPTTDDSNPSQMKWTGNIPAGGSVTIKFKVSVNLGIPCQETIWNRAYLLAAGLQLVSNPVGVHVVCQPVEAFSDFGDAPDSEANHYGMSNTAYPVGPVLGRYPSVWDNTPAALPSGPNHLRANQYWLGDRVTQEKDADLLPDADAVTNILNAGAGDTANNDKADDGWLNPGAPMPNCGKTELKVRISRALIPPPVSRLYLNVWFDGNRDGDWNDTGECPQIQARSFEWIVQNWWIDPTTIPAAGFIDVAVPTVLIHNLQPNADAWIRFTLSEQRAIPAPGPALPDGRGPAFPTSFALGETEDYLRKGEQVGQPGQITIEKRAQPAGPVNIGDVVTYTVLVQHVGGSGPASTVMTDVLPVGVVLLGPPVVTELAPSVVPLIASFNAGIGPSGAVVWQGTMTPNSAVQIQFRVRVRECVNPLINRAVALNTNNTLVEAKTQTGVNCQPVDPKITLAKSVLVQNETQAVANGVILPGQTAVYYLTLTSTDGLSHTVHISDNIPVGLVATAVSASSGVAAIVNAGQSVVWDGVLGPATSPVTIKIAVQTTDRVRCEQRLVNVARWSTRNAQGQSNEAVLLVACRDLGDAPDSTNNAGVKMTAYPLVTANFPTVFTVAAPDRGPRHEQPRPFHLGKGVSGEVEADLGPDMDGVNNIQPTSDTANRDKADDGLRLSTVSFKHCQMTTMIVDVAIAPGAAALLPNGIGYLNVWVDSNRDGDWGDNYECPNAAGALTASLEHIVIDLPINATALGAGLHAVSVPTSAPVFWRPEIAQQPAWLRMTLSERPSNKPLNIGTVQYGDGRGHDDPFRLGETEDFLLRPEGQTTADPSVTKHGEIWPDYDPVTNQRRWMIGWVINYANAGPAAASNVHVVDTYDPPQTLVAEHSIPFVPHTTSGNTLDYNVGTLPAGGSGIIILRTEVPFNTAPGTVLRNSAVINSNNDGNGGNNNAVATVTVPILPPLISGPLAGTTCTDTVTVVGWVQPGAEVDLYVDGVLAVSGITSASHGNGLGDWSYVLPPLADGSHTIHAVARAGSLTSDPSPSVTIIVDSTLFWDPISLRVTADDGHVVLPSGRLDPSGWSLFLRPGHTYTASLRICCADPNAQVTMEIGSIVVTLSDPDGDRTFTGVFTVPATGRFTGVVRICVTCNLIRVCSDGEVTIDPEGTVFDVMTGAPINGALVACTQAGMSAASSQQVFSLWMPSANSGQINPQTVGSDGYFSFFTPPGTFRLDVSKQGYQQHTSSDIVVVDAPVHYDVPLTPLIADVAGQQIAMTDSGFEPSIVTVAPGTVVEWLNADTSVHSSTSITPSVFFSGADVAAAAVNGAWDSGLLDASETYKFKFDTLGVYSYRDAADPTATATIIVAEPVVVEKKLFLPIISR